MADRSVNININYKVNTVEIQKSEQLVNKATAATNNLNSATQKATTNSAKGYQSAGKSIESMKIRLDQLKAQIQLTSTTDTARLHKLSAEYRALDAQIKQVNKTYLETSKATSSAASQTKSLTSEFGGLYSSVKLFLTAGLAKEFIDTALSAASLAGKVDGVTMAFNRLPNSTLLLNSLRKATQGTVGDLELMQRALMSQSYKIPLTNLAKLLEFAAIRAQQTGQEVNHLVDYIVSGIGLRSIKRLDDLGFTAARVKEALGGVTLQAASMGEVTDAVTKLMNEDIQQFGGYVDTSETKVKQLNVSLEELRVEAAKAGQGISEFIVDQLTEATNGLKDYIKLLREARESQPTDEQELSEDGFKDFLRKLMNAEDEHNKAFGRMAAEREAIRQMEFTQQTKLTEEVLKNSDLATEIIKSEIAISDERLTKNKSEISQLKERFRLLNSFRDQRADEKTQTESLAFFNKEVDKVMKSQNVSRKDAKQLVIDSNEEIKKAISFYEYQNLVIGEYGNLLDKTLKDVKKVLPEITEELGIIDKLQEDIKSIGESIGAAKSEKEIFRLQVQLANLNEELERLQNLSKFKDPVASQVFDIRRTEINAGFKSSVTAESLQADLDKLTGDLTAKAKVELTRGDGMSLGEQVGLEFSESWREITTQGIMDTTDLLNSFVQAELDSYDARLNALQNYYDEQINLAGNNERAKTLLALKRDREEQKLRKKAFDAEKDAKRKQTIINGAAGVINAFATLPYPAAIVAAALIAAKTVAEIAIIGNQNYSGYAKGVLNLKGPGTATSDSIPARLSKGESVMTASETKNSFGILKEIRAKRLDDNVMKDLRQGRERVQYVGMNDKRIVSELKAIRDGQPDLVKQGNIIFEVRRKGDNYRQRIRSKSMGI